MIDLKSRLQQFPKINLTRKPTPLVKLRNLSDQLGLNLFIKRDDLTDLAMGGDKARKLEFELGKAMTEGANHIVTCGSAQSNHIRLTTSASRKLGMEISIIASNDEYNQNDGNLLLSKIMGADVRFVNVKDHWDLEAYCNEKVSELTAKGKKPYYIPVSGTTSLSTLGYIVCGLEVIDQQRNFDIEFEYLYSPFGTGGILVGLTTAFQGLGVGTKFCGISVNRNSRDCLEIFDTLSKEVLSKLQLNLEINTPEIYDQFIGKGYGDPTRESIDAIRRMGREEGILMDPVYSGKMFSGFLQHFKHGHFTKNSSILLLHSGGVPSLFPYKSEFQST